jgi:AraC-like DNA-binding protein
MLGDANGRDRMRGDAVPVEASLYREVPPPVDLATHIACLWTQTVGPDSSYVHRVLPDGCIDLIWYTGSLHVAGPDTGPFLAHLVPGLRIAAVRFRPGMAPAVLGVPADVLRDDRVELAEIWGTDADRLSDQIAASDPPTATRILAREVGRRLRNASDPPDPIATAVPELARRRLDVRELAEHIGLSERQLRRRSLAAFGYGPKTLQRILRFRRAVALARRGVPFVDVAVDAGYADQPHLAREVRELAGVSLGELIGADRAGDALPSDHLRRAA